MSKAKVSLSVKDNSGKVTKIAEDINNLSPEGREIAKGIVDTLNAAAQAPDIFSWANLADAQKNEMKLNLFVFNKNMTVYSLRHSKGLAPYIRSTFLYDLINDVTMGAATGLKIRDIHVDDGTQENVIDTATLESIPNAQAVIEQIAYGVEQVVEFNHGEHLTKMLAGVVLECVPENQKPFYIVKQLQKSNLLEGGSSWSWNAGKLDLNPLEAAVKMPTDNQVLVVGEQLFVFNVAKFSKMFRFDAQKKAKLDSKVTEIEKKFKLSFPDGLDLQKLVDSNASLAEKLMRSEPSGITQEQVIEQADKFQLALMTDDAGAIIIMDGRDAIMFANLLNDDYVESQMTDRHYVAVKKKEVSDAETKQLHLGA